MISWTQFRESEGVDDWRNLSGGATAMYRTTSFAAATSFAAGVGALEEMQDDPPRIDIRHEGVTIQLSTTTDTYSGMSERDVERARAITALAREHGLVPDPLAVQSVLIYVGTPGAEVLPFWRAVLGYESARGAPEEGIVDPHRRGPGLWVEPMDEAPHDVGAVHIAIWVPHEVAETRVAEAVAAGGRLVRDKEAPAWWTLADAAGNQADIATTLGRD